MPPSRFPGLTKLLGNYTFPRRLFIRLAELPDSVSSGVYVDTPGT